VRVWLARHGATTAPPGTAIGWTDVGLSSAGWRQAEILASRLEPHSLERIYSSDLRRAVETASVVADRRHLRVQPTPDLRELNFGKWEQWPLERLWSESPDEARAWELDFTALPSSFGETMAQLESRVGCFVSELISGDGDALVVGHRGSLTVLHALLTGSSIEAVWALGFELGGLRQVETPGNHLNRQLAHDNYPE
jgi:alpha-ribazole phosphatase